MRKELRLLRPDGHKKTVLYIGLRSIQMRPPALSELRKRGYFSVVEIAQLLEATVAPYKCWRKSSSSPYLTRPS